MALEKGTNSICFGENRIFTRIRTPYPAFFLARISKLMSTIGVSSPAKKSCSWAIAVRIYNDKKPKSIEKHEGNEDNGQNDQRDEKSRNMKAE